MRIFLSTITTKSQYEISRNESIADESHYYHCLLLILVVELLKLPDLLRDRLLRTLPALLRERPVSVLAFSLLFVFAATLLFR